MARWAVVVMPPTSTPARKVLVPSASKTRQVRYDIAVVGGGIVGLATSRELLRRHPRLRLVNLEKESDWHQHQSGHNSGVIHSGIYYKPGSLKAKLCVEGRKLLWDYCADKRIPYKNVGKLIVATNEAEIPRLMDLYERGRANGVERLELLDGAQIREREPHCRGIKAIASPVTGIVDYRVVARSYAADVKALGGELLLSHEISGFRRRNGITLLESPAGDVESRHTVTCAGLYSDALARMTGGARDPKIVPFRGDYLILKPEKRYLVNGNIYPVPDPNFPFLGVHFTPRMDGDIWLGPNAVLAFAREGYRFSDVKAKELLDAVAYPGFLRLALRYWQTGAGEMFRDLSRKAYVKALQRYIPELTPEDCLPGPSGVRAQAMRANGELVDDFVFDGAEGIVHVRNAPSPGATSSLAIARFIADEAERRFDLTGSTIAT
jgi:L-2-hydroxyglutarate oxidase LhgO